MTISDRIFETLALKNITQKEFSDRTGIKPSAISEWKKRKTNPSSEKIMSICDFLNVTPEWLLSGIDGAGSRSEGRDFYTVEKHTETGELITCFNALDPAQRKHLLKYAEFISAAEKEGKTKSELDELDKDRALLKLMGKLGEAKISVKEEGTISADDLEKELGV